MPALSQESCTKKQQFVVKLQKQNNKKPKAKLKPKPFSSPLLMEAAEVLQAA